MSSSTEDRIPVGRIGKAHGIRGEVMVLSMSDYPDRFRPGQILLTDDEPPRELEVTGSRLHNQRLLVSFRGVSDRNAAERLRGRTLTISTAERRQLAEDEVWPEDLEGMVVLTPAGDRIGVVDGMVLGESQDRLIVRTPDGRDVEVPFVDPIVAEIHPSGGFVVVDAPEGLF